MHETKCFTYQQHDAQTREEEQLMGARSSAHRLCGIWGDVARRWACAASGHDQTTPLGVALYKKLYMLMFAQIIRQRSKV